MSKKVYPATTLSLKHAMHMDPYFNGVYPINRLPTPKKKNSVLKLIVNLAMDSLPGTHWVVIYGSRDRMRKYFDLFGDYPPMELQRWMNANSRKWDCSYTQVQSLYDINCGQLCLKFLNSV